MQFVYQIIDISFLYKKPAVKQRVLSMAGKPGSVVNGHLSRGTVAGTLQRYFGITAGSRGVKPASILLRVGFTAPPCCRGGE